MAHFYKQMYLEILGGIFSEFNLVTDIRNLQ